MEITAGNGDDGRAVLRVSGELDTEVADELRQAGLDAVAANPAGFAIDLSGITFIDSRGVAALIAINNELQPPHPPLTLAKPSRPVRRILELTGLDRTFVVSD